MEEKDDVQEWLFQIDCVEALNLTLGLIVSVKYWIVTIEGEDERMGQK